MTLYPGNLGGDVALKPSLTPRDNAAAASFSLKGSGVDMQNHDTFVGYVSVGPTTGAPDSFTVDARLEHSDDDVDGNYAAVVVNPQNAAVAITQVTAVNTTRRIEIDRRGLKRFVRWTHTIAFVNGTSPKVGISSGFAVGGSVIKPVSQS